MTDRELLQMALDALDIACRKYGEVGNINTDWGQWDSAMTALRARLAQPEPVPVAWYDVEHGETETIWSSQRPPWEGDWKPLYTAPDTQPEPERYPFLNGRHINNESKLWVVFCVNCKKQWPVPYPHSGKSICAECEKKRNADYQGNDWTQNDSEYNK